MRLHEKDPCPECGERLVSRHVRSVSTLFRKRRLLYCQMCHFKVVARRRKAVEAWFGASPAAASHFKAVPRFGLKTSLGFLAGARAMSHPFVLAFVLATGLSAMPWFTWGGDSPPVSQPQQPDAADILAEWKSRVLSRPDVQPVAAVVGPVGMIAFKPPAPQAIDMPRRGAEKASNGGKKHRKGRHSRTASANGPSGVVLD